MVESAAEVQPSEAAATLAGALGALPRERAQTLPALHLLHHIEGYLSAAGMEHAAAWLHVPKSELYAVATSYSEFRFAPPPADAVRVCHGLSCRIAGSERAAAELRAQGREVEEHECMFLCAAAQDAPITAEGSESLEDAISGNTHAAARRKLEGGLTRVTAQRSAHPPRWRGWETASQLSPAQALERLERSGLLGRGGAYFPVHAKWRGAIEAAARNGRPLLVANGEEGEPGTFKDRWLMESDPQRIIEGIRIACHVLGADRAFCYVNGLADRSAAAMAEAIAAAESAELMDDLSIEIRRGAGGYVCGEESVILESIEGRRAVPRLKPPYPTERGLWGRPTAINSVETLANLPDIFEFGPDWFREVGAENAPGTKLIQLSGAFRNRGVVELPLGTPVSEIVELAEPSEPLDGVTMGGPSGGFLAPANFDTPILPGAMDGHGALLGAGGIIGIPERFGIAATLRVWSEYNANESCGKCTPCREGSGRISEALARLAEGDEDAQRDIDALIPLIAQGSLCGLGQMAPNPITSARRQFGGEIA